MKKSRSYMRSAALLIVVCVIFALMGNVVYAATLATINEVTLSSSGSATWDVDVDKKTISGSVEPRNLLITVTSKNGTLTIENTSQTTEKIVEFNYTSNSAGAEVTVNGENAKGVSTPKKVVVKLGTGASFTVYLKSGGDSTSQVSQIWITDFKVSDVVAATTQLCIPEYGSYTANNGTKSVTVSAGDTSSGGISYDTDTGLQLEAEATNNGMKFYRWETAEGTVISYNRTDTIREVYTSIIPKYINGSYVLAYKVGADYYYSWEDAITAANPGGTVIISENYTLPATVAGQEKTGTYVSADGIYTLPQNTKLLVPKSITDTGCFSSVVEHSAGTSLTTPKAFRKLTLEENVKIVANGDINVNATIVCASPKFNNVTGDYGCIMLSTNSEIIMNQGTTLYCYGYIAGNGQVTVESAANVYEAFQFNDWTGGNYALKWAQDNTSDLLFYSTQYYVQNIESNLKVKTGANCTAVAYAYAMDTYFPGDRTGEAKMIGTSGALFNLAGEDSYILRKYDASTDRITYSVYGDPSEGYDVTTGNIDVDMSYTQLSSQGKILGLNGNMSIDIMCGSVTIGTDSVQTDFALLPGTKIYIADGATVNVHPKSNIYIFDVLDWNQGFTSSSGRKYNGFVYNGRDMAAINYTVANGITVKRTGYSTSGRLIVDGELIGDNNIYVSQSSNTSVDKVLSGVGKFTNLGSAAAQKTKIHPFGFYKPNSISYSMELADVTVIPLVGKFADDYNSIQYTEPADYAEFSTGTYYAHPDNNGTSTDTWYQYTITYKYTDTDGNEVEKVTYTPTNSATFNSATDLDENKKYVIKGYTVEGTAKVEGSPNSDASIGLEELSFSSIESNLIVNLTIEEFDYRVNWTDSTNNATWIDYIVGDTVAHTWDSIQAFEVTITDGEGAKANVQWEASYVEAETLTDSKSTLTLTGISEDINVAVTMSSDTQKVTWLENHVETKTEYIKTGGSTQYNVTQPENGWRVIDSYTNSNENNCVVANSKESFAISNIQGNVTIDLEIVEYDCKILLIPKTDSTSGETAEPIYVNFTSEDSITIESTELGDSPKYIFVKADVSTNNATAAVSNYGMSLTLSDLNGDLVTAMVDLQRYDYCVTIQENGNVVAKQFITGQSTSYEFDEGVAIGSVTCSNATVTPTNPEIGGKAKVDISNVTDETVVNVTTYGFDHIVTFLDAGTNTQLKREYTKADTVTCNWPNEQYYVTAISIQNESVGKAENLIGVNEEFVTISVLTDHPTILVTRTSYDKKVEWIDTTGDKSKTDYLQANEATATYNCETGYVAYVKSSTVANSNLSAESGETITVSNVNGNETINLQFFEFQHKVEFVADGAIVKTQYANDSDKDVITGGSILYNAYKPEYIKNCKITGTATIVGTDNINVNVADGWESLKVTNIDSNVTIDLTLGTYDYKVTWIVKTSLDGVNTNTKLANYITKDPESGKGTDSYTLDEKYTITDIAPKSNTEGIGTNIATVSNIEEDVAVTVVAQDYLYTINWIYNGEDHEVPVKASDIVEGVVTWTMPDELSDYVVTGVSATNGSADHTNKTVSFTRAADATAGSECSVTITLQIAEDGYTYYFGNMAYKYSKNKAYYTYDNGWKLMEQYTWSRVAGSKVYTVYEESEDGISTLEKLYSVPNGSVLLVNNSNQIIEATIEVTADYGWITMKLKANNADKTVGTVTSVTDEVTGITTNVSTITITLKPGEEVIVTGDIEGSPDNEYETESAAGFWSVTMVAAE